MSVVVINDRLLQYTRLGVDWWNSAVTQRELSDAEWALIEPLLAIGRSGPYPHRLREQVEAVIWRFRTGGQWRRLPLEFGPWQSVYDAFARWRDACAARKYDSGAWPAVLRSGYAAT